jgi:hypothetical protein
MRRRPTSRISVFGVVLALSLPWQLQACDRERDMPDRAEMPDSMPVMRALEDPAAADSMLDTLPGGEMVRGDSSAAARLLRDKM